MDTQPLCPSCRKPLPPDLPLGLCPECLIKAGFPTGAESGSAVGTASSFVPPSLSVLAGVFPQLELLEFIGKGGMGAVYKARQKQLDRIVALKILPPGVGTEAGFAERFAREARALARLNHPGIVTLFEFGQAGPLYFFLMEFVDGVNLRQLLATRQTSAREALAIVPQICDALQFAHDQGIVHRDIKPENILLDRRGRVKLADFGLVKLVESGPETAPGLGPIGIHSTLTEAGKVMGTPNYMAPEQQEHPGEVDNRADIYALGMVFYQMLTGQLPDKPVLPPSRKVQLDVRLDDVVLRALENRPELRYQQASELKTRVETIAGTPPPPAAGIAPASVPPPPTIAPGKPASAVSGRDLVTIPAIGLLITGGWKLLSALKILVYYAAPASVMDDILSNLGLSGLHWRTFLMTSTFLFSVVPGILIAHGAWQMLRLSSHAWAVLAAILAILVCGLSSLLGLPMGIWALVVLTRPVVIEAFRTNQPRTKVGSSLGNVVLVLLLVFLLLFASLAGLAVWAISHSSPVAHPGGSTTSAENGDFHQDFHLNLPLAADGSFSLDNVNGQVTVTGWDRDEVYVSAVKHAGSQDALDAIKIDHDATDRSISIHTRQPSDKSGSFWIWEWLNHRPLTVDYAVQGPKGARLENVESVNGKVHISGVSGDIKASTVNGATEVEDAAASLHLETVNGLVKAEFVRLGIGQQASFNAVNGKIEVTLPANADANVTASTVNGSISSEFPALSVEKEFPFGRTLHGTLGQGGAQVHAETVNGAIRFVQGVGTGTTGSVSFPWYLKVSLEDQRRGKITAEIKTSGVKGETIKTFNDLPAGTRTVLYATDWPDGDYYAWFSAPGHASQWRAITIKDHQLTPPQLNVELFQARQVVIRYAFNLIGERTLSGANVETGRLTLTHWGKLPHFGRDWQIWQKAATNNVGGDSQSGGQLFGDTPWLEFHRFSPGFGFSPVPAGAAFDDLKEAPADAAYQCENQKAVKGLTLFCRVNGNNPTDIGYGKIVVEDVMVPSDQTAADDAAPPPPTVANQPPVVVETDPVAGAHDVSPGLTEIRVRFSKPMMNDSWSWSTAWENSTPASTGDPHYLADRRTCVLPVKLAPGTTYGFWLNSEKFRNFTDRDGRPAVPYLLLFNTKSSN